MLTWTHRLALTAICAAALALASAPISAAEAYASPAEVHPLLLGSEVPSVEVLTLDGAAVDLKAAVGDTRTVVIFYRGGW